MEYNTYAPHEKPRILIAEDFLDNYRLLNCLLHQDYQLSHAKNGLEAITLFKTFHPDLILMDIKMPRMDGYKATAEIRKISASVPIIALTACVFPEDVKKITQNGFNNFLPKPIDITALKDLIYRYLSS